MDAPIVRGLNDKLYDRRKAAALELEKVVSTSDPTKITQIVNQLCLMFTSPSSPLHARNGGLIGLAATAIALGQDFSRWLPVVIPRVLGCFGDAESRVRYYACESLYNIAKVCKGEVLVHFNGIFDALSRLSADVEASVKNGAELLDRLLKDIVSETALNYVSRYPENVDKTFNLYDSESWHEGHRHGYASAAGSYGRQGVAGGLGGFERARTHPLEDSPVMLVEARERGDVAQATSIIAGGLGPGAAPGNPGLGLGMENTKSGSRQASLSHSAGQGLATQTPGSLDDGKARIALPASGSKGSSNGGELSVQRPDAAVTRDPSPHSIHGSIAPIVSPNPSFGPTKGSTGHHRVVSSNSLASPNPGLHSQLHQASDPPPRLAFSLAKFVPLLSERIYVISPFTRSHLVSWITILDSVPDLELVSYLPDFLDGLLKYLSDPSPDVKIATENVLSDFLREIKHIARVQQRQYQDSMPVTGRTQGTTGASTYRRSSEMHPHGLRRRGSKMTMDTEASEMESSVYTGNGTTADENAGMASPELNQLDELKEEDDEDGDASGRWEPPRDSALEDYEDDNDAAEHSAWVPGQGIYVDHQAIMDIMIHHLGYPDEQIQSIALRWTASFLTFAHEVMVGFTPRLMPAILPNLAHHVPYIQAAAIETNQSLFRVIQAIPPPATPTGGITPTPAPPTATTATSASTAPQASVPMTISGSQAALTPATSAANSLSISPGARREQGDAASAIEAPSRRRSQDMGDGLKPSISAVSVPNTVPGKSRMMTASPVPTTQPQTPTGPDFASKTSRPTSPSMMPVSTSSGTMDEEPFDIRETVNILTLQFLSEHVETRVAALEWLSMLHAKAPRKILARDDGTFPALLKTLSDPSEEVVRHDLQLLAQISASSDDSYFTSFLVNLLELFSTDRRLLETRGSLIIRQLCLNLNVERIFRTLGEVLEREDDLEFASLMVVKLNMILITSPELSDFRKRLRNIESKDGQMLFTSIYKSWCHNAVAVFALCLLAQAYEHASNLLQIFAELDMTVALLVQIDKLVMLIESPVFTSLRLQLLEPEKYPYLFKCLYGLLMLLPQSSAFVSLRNRLSAVSSMGFLHIAPRSAFNASDKVATARSKITGRDEIKWQELLVHFRAVQKKHEKARRQTQTGEGAHGHSMSGFNFSGPSATSSPQQTAGSVSNDRMTIKDRRKVGALGSNSRKDSGQSSTSGKGQSSVLSPLNPKRVGSTGGSGSATTAVTGSFSAMSISAPFMTTMGINGNTTSAPGTSGRARSPPPAGNGGRSRTILPGLRR